MSSHHVIRDEQEPPVFIFTDAFNLETLKELLGWSPLLYVDINYMRWFEALKIKVDAYLDLNLENVDTLEVPVLRIDSFFRTKSYLQLVRDILGIRKFTAINIFCTNDQRTRILQELTHHGSFDYPLRLFVKAEKTIVGNSTEFKKWFPKGQKLRLSEYTTLYPSVRNVDSYYTIENEGLYRLTSEAGKIIFTEL